MQSLLRALLGPHGHCLTPHVIQLYSQLIHVCLAHKSLLAVQSYSDFRICLFSLYSSITSIP